MASTNAQAVAHKVVDKVRKGEKVNLGELISASGYSKNIAKQPTRITKQKAYQEIVTPVLQQLESERQRIITAMGKKNLGKEKYQTLVQSMDIITRNTQLLGGKATDNVAIQVSISEQVGNKYANVSNNDEKPKSAS